MRAWPGFLAFLRGNKRPRGKQFPCLCPPTRQSAHTSVVVTLPGLVFALHSANIARHSRRPDTYRGPQAGRSCERITLSERQVPISHVVFIDILVRIIGGRKAGVAVQDRFNHRAWNRLLRRRG